MIKFRPSFLCVPRGLVVKLTPGASKVLSSSPDRTFSCSLLLFSFLLFFFSFSFHFRYNSFVMFLYTIFRFTNFLLGFTCRSPEVLREVLRFTYFYSFRNVIACTMQLLRKFNNREERSIGALNAKCWSGRKIRLPLSSSVVGNTPLVSFMFFARNFVAWGRWTKPCGQNTSHSNSDCHYEQKNEDLPQSESESTVQNFLNTMLLGFRIRSSW